jgi:rhamnogalacturonyl hydrolase YesR
MNSARALLTLFFSIAFSALHSAQPSSIPVRAAVPDSTRILPISGDTAVGTRHALFTHRRTQYAAFFAADSTLVLARRAIGSDTWETHSTRHAITASDAANALAFVVDGAGFLHVAWTGSGDTLNYTRSVSTESLELGPLQPLPGSADSRLTAPFFLLQANGDLLFLHHRDTTAGSGLTLHRYAISTGTWSSVQEKLVADDARRAASATLAFDRYGMLHLAWIWQATGAASTPRDIAYARSADGGETWTGSDGLKPLALPLTAATAERALSLVENAGPLTQSTIAADNEGHPLIAGWWASDGSAFPQLHLLRHNGNEWQLQSMTHRQTRLTGEKNAAPISPRPLLYCSRGVKNDLAAYLVYRDDEQAGRTVIASCENIAATPPVWTVKKLNDSSLGTCEPAADPELWRRFKQLHLLVSAAAPTPGGSLASRPLASLIWSPYLERMATVRASNPDPIPLSSDDAKLDRPLVPVDILALLERAADWQLAAPYKRDLRGWEIAPFYIGALEVSRLSSSPRLASALSARFEDLKWSTRSSRYHADDHCVIQAYAELHRRSGDRSAMAPSLALFDQILAKPALTPLDWGYKFAQDRWTWCDALFMAPASWLDAYLLTADRRYLDFMNSEWWLTTDALFSSADGLFFRDESFLDLREPNGRCIYWSRGNGWVVAGLARVLSRFPRDHVDYPRYVRLYERMMEAVLATQQSDGLWRPGLLDPAAHSVIESSGSGFNCYALAWGLNHGLLDRTRFEPATRRAWNALAACVNSDGRLEHVQPVGSAPANFSPTHTDAFGAGALLLAGSEIHALATGRPSPVYNQK